MDKAAGGPTIIAEAGGIMAYHKNKPPYNSVRKLLRTDGGIRQQGHNSLTE